MAKKKKQLEITMDTSDWPKKGQNRTALRVWETRYNPDYMPQIRSLYSMGKTLSEIQNILNIDSSIWYSWMVNDYLGFRTSINDMKRESIINKAENNLSEMLDSSKDHIRADLTKFTLETIGKDKGYSRKVEIKGTMNSGVMEKEDLDNLLNNLKEKVNK